MEEKRRYKKSKLSHYLAARRLVSKRCRVLCWRLIRSVSRTQSMRRLVARFLLLIAFAGNLFPLAMAATIAPRHACCIRKAAHPCHGSANSESDHLVISSSSCCRQDCSRAVTTSHSANLGARNVGFSYNQIRDGVVLASSLVPSLASRGIQSTRAPPQLSIA